MSDRPITHFPTPLPFVHDDGEGHVKAARADRPARGGEMSARDSAFLFVWTVLCIAVGYAIGAGW